jgi:hypothetical protein
MSTHFFSGFQARIQTEPEMNNPVEPADGSNHRIFKQNNQSECFLHFPSKQPALRQYPFLPERKQ